MSRKLLSLAYIYEIKAEYKKAMVFYQSILENDDSLNSSMLLEARLGLRACQIALKNEGSDEFFSKNLDRDKLKEKVNDFLSDENNIVGWLSRWN